MAFGKEALALLLGRRKEICISGKLKINWGSNFFEEGSGRGLPTEKGVVFWRKSIPTLPHGEAVRRGWGTRILCAGCLHPTHARSSCAWMGHPALLGKGVRKAVSGG